MRYKNINKLCITYNFALLFLLVSLAKLFTYPVPGASFPNSRTATVIFINVRFRAVRPQ
jgi:hypothetical protein